MSSPINFRATKGKPCQVCGHETKGCSATENGLHLCRGEPGADWKQITKDPDTAGFHHYRHQDDTTNLRNGHRVDPRPTLNPAPKPSVSSWRRKAEEYHDALTPALFAELSQSLGLPIRAFKAMPLIGWCETVASWTFPEMDASATIIGISRRPREGEKKRMAGAKCGLSIPVGWEDRTGPVFLVEGPTDSLAMSLCGLSAIGRPSNTGGVALLTELLQGFPGDREIIVVGENDSRPSKTKPGETDWPGRMGAETTAQQLAKSLGRPVSWSMPPAGVKDVRQWVVDRAAGSVKTEDYLAIGGEIAGHLIANVVQIDPPVGGKLKEIIIDVDEHRVNDEAAAVLATMPDLYQRAGALVHVRFTEAEPDDEAIIRRPIGAPVVREIPQPLLRTRLTKCASFFSLRERKDGIQKVPEHPPGWCVQDVHTRGEWPKVRHLEAVVAHPVFLQSGEILAANGYDRRSRLLVAVPSDLTVSVPDRPTKADVAAAVETLNDALTDFPFQTDAHRAAWFAGLLTPLAWFGFDGPAPMFLIDANVRGAGKGLLGDVIALTVTGRRFSTMSYTNDREELRKRITTLAVEGERMVMLDNLAGSVGNDVLDAALTSDRWKDRLLGGNRVYDGPLHVSWFATGNNVQLGTDTPRRVCHIRMDSQEERPELKCGFRHPDLRAYVRKDRGRLLAAALTILHGWHTAGRPNHGLPSWGSYEGWSGVVREAVVFAGLPDPGETRLAIQTSSDRDAEAMTAFISCLEQFDLGKRGVTAAEVIDEIRKKESNNKTLQSDLKSSVEDLCGKIDGRALGYKLRHFARRNFAGKMIDRKGGGHGGVLRWGIVPVGATLNLTETCPPSQPSPPPKESSSGGDGCDGGHVSAQPKSATKQSGEEPELVEGEL